MKFEAKEYPDGFWAKYSYDADGTLRWHHLICHSADVAAVFGCLLRSTILNNRLARLLGWQELNEVQIQRLSALAALHDAGKANHGFQNLINPRARLRGGHVRPIIEAMNSLEAERILLPLQIEKMISWFEEGQDDLFDMLLATWGHHGRPVNVEYNFKFQLWADEATRKPVECLTHLGNKIVEWFPRAFTDDTLPFPSNTKFQHAYNGVLTLADWLGSDTRYFEYSRNTESHMTESRRQADYVVAKVGLDAKRTQSELSAKELGFDIISDYPPYDIQARCLDLPIESQGSLVIVESDTGSGKTEAALARFLKLYQSGEVDGLYFAVPTRAAATQLHRRVTQIVARAFVDPPPVVLAVPGYIRVDDIDGIALPEFKVRWPDSDDLKHEHRGWTAQGPKRYLAAPIAVGTIDQVLLSALKVSHSHMRAAALLRHFLVVDEIHSSDAYMNKLIEKVLARHLAAGGHALLMSATLGDSTRRMFTSDTRKDVATQSAIDMGYPLITYCNGSRTETSQIITKHSGYQKTVTVTTKPFGQSPEDIAQLAIEHASKGARVLIIRNRVQDCIETQYALEANASDSSILFSLNGTPIPHHSRYSAADRKLLDRRMEFVFGKASREQGVIAVATQTVEQSLDIDADILITDICPIDVLLQRIGRLHRHPDRIRPPGFECAKAYVITPEERDLSTYISDSGNHKGRGYGPMGLGTVYKDLRVLEATWRLLEETDDQWHIPSQNRYLVENGTHPEILTKICHEFGDSWLMHLNWITGEDLADRVHASYLHVDWDKSFGDELFSTDMEQIQTRLGQLNTDVIFPEKIVGPFQTTIAQLSVPGWWVRSDGEQITAGNVYTEGDAIIFCINNLQFKYDRLGLHRMNESDI